MILPQVPKSQWMTPSQAQPKTHLGHENHTRFRITARLNDGHPVWTGWFDDRDDADAFLHAIATDTLHIQPALWTLPTPMWTPGMAEQLSYHFSTTVYLTNTGQTSYTTPLDWSPINTVECIAGGGGGGCGQEYNNGGNGGGGGAYSSGTVVTIGPNTTITINIGAAGNAINQNGGAGTNGGSTWFNGSSLASSSVGAQYGFGGGSGTGSPDFTYGGQASAGTGTTLYSGGNGGRHSYGGGGGGGAAGPFGAGGAGTNSNQASGGTGGQGDNGHGGAGGGQNQSGSSGNEYYSGLGCGGGGGGGGGDSAQSGGSNGGYYGAGGGAGGQSTSGWYNGGGGTQGFMVLTYTPGTAGFFSLFRR
jgi:hypothetical protein